MTADSGFMKMIKTKPKQPSIQEKIDQIIKQSKDRAERIIQKSNDFTSLADELLNKPQQ